jgi:superfamily II DNA or RNA helicase
LRRRATALHLRCTIAGAPSGTPDQTTEIADFEELITFLNLDGAPASDLELLWYGLPVQFRPHQVRGRDHCVKRLEDSTCLNPLLASPTGSGKSWIAVALGAWFCTEGKRTLYLVNRREQVRQLQAWFAELGIEVGVIGAKRDFPSHPNRLIQIGLVQSCVRRADLPQFDLIIVDECHHAAAPTWRKILAGQLQARVIGFTATPARKDGKGLGRSSGGPFDEIIEIATARGLIRRKLLCRYAWYLSPHAKRLVLQGVRVHGGDWREDDLELALLRAELEGYLVREYADHADHQRALVFCVTVKLALRARDAFRQAGYRAECIHGQLSGAERDRLMAAFAAGEIEILTSCEVLGEGLDIPGVSCVILMRPTQSLTVFLQQVGRGMRTAAGKRRLIVIDMVANVTRHGLPDQPRTWSLDGVKARSGPNREPVWLCSECQARNPLSVETCQECGAERRHDDRQLSADVDVRLTRIKEREKQKLLAQRRREEAAAAEALRQQREAADAARRAQEAEQRRLREDVLQQQRAAERQRREAERLAWERDQQERQERQRVGRPEVLRRFGHRPEILAMVKLHSRDFLTRYRSPEELEAFQMWNGYKPGWVWHRQRDQLAEFGRP